MRAVERDAEWETHEVSDGQPAGTYKARDIFRKMADAAHLCGDPGIQYDTTINDWHTSAASDRIYASNPCVNAATRSSRNTDEGCERSRTHRGPGAANTSAPTASRAPRGPHLPDRPGPYSSCEPAGYRVRITADHLVATTRGMTAVKDLVAGEVTASSSTHPRFRRAALRSN